MPASDRTSPLAHVRTIPVWALIVVVIAYLAIIQGVSLLASSGMDIDYGQPHTVEEVWRSMTIAIGLSFLFVFAVVAVLRWWKPVFIDDRPVQRWVWVVPAIMVVTILAGANYGGLAEQGLSFTALMLVTALLVGFAEEGMFRGIAVTTFRVNRFSEVKVALWSTVIFGLAHATNLFSEGPKVILQVLVTILAGYLFYLVRRVSGGLLVPALLHGLWDFALLSSYVVEDETYAGALLFILANVVLLAIVIARRHRIEPSTEAAPQPAAV